MRLLYVPPEKLVVVVVAAESILLYCEPACSTPCLLAPDPLFRRQECAYDSFVALLVAGIHRLWRLFPERV
jgi:hypothetical protein